VVIVIGAEDRIKVETVNQELSAQIQQVYDRARNRQQRQNWYLLTIDSEKVVEEVVRLLALKRKPSA